MNPKTIWIGRVGGRGITLTRVTDIKVNFEIVKSGKERLARENQKEKGKVTVRAHCHSLRNYGQVKNKRILLKALKKKTKNGPKRNKKMPKLVPATTKDDLLPSQFLAYSIR